MVTTDRVVEGPSEELLVWRSERGLKLSSAAGAAEVGVWFLGGHAGQLATRSVADPKDDDSRVLRELRRELGGVRWLGGR